MRRRVSASVVRLPFPRFPYLRIVLIHVIAINCNECRNTSSTLGICYAREKLPKSADCSS